MVQLKCPQCGAAVEGQPGRVARCARCGFQATVPGPAGAPAPTRIGPPTSAPPPSREAGITRSVEPPAKAKAPAREPARKAAPPPPRQAAPAPEPPAAAPESKVKYLVVDDSATIRKHLAYLIKLLAPGDDEIAMAASPRQAIEKFRQTRPEVVFLDMMMPEEHDGVSALKGILKEQPDATVVVVTALQQDHESVLEAISNGAKAYLRKPITVRGLQQALDELEAQSGRFRRVS